MKTSLFMTTGMASLFSEAAMRSDNGTVALPEPGTILLLGVAIAGLGLILFWRSRKK